MKIIYAGSPLASQMTLQYLYENQAAGNYEIAGVISNPPTAKGRHKELTPTPVAAYALEKGIPVFTPEHLDAEAREQVSSVSPDFLVSFAYGHIFGPKFLALFPMGAVNLHPSMLPKYRGCTPVPAAILNRDDKTAVSVQTVSLKMDEGDILAQQIIELDGTETGESLLNNSADIGGKLIFQLLKDCSANGKLPAGVSQTGETSYTKIITKNDARINWNDSAENIEAAIRAYYPDPGCWTEEKGLPLKVLAAKCLMECKDFENEPAGKVVAFNKAEGILVKTGNGILSLQRLQRQGKNAMAYKDFMNGARDFVGTVLQ